MDRARRREAGPDRRALQQRVRDARRVRSSELTLGRRGSFIAAQRARPDLHRDQGGVATPAGGRALIINTASVSAWRGARFTEQAAHGAAKGGVLALTRHLAASGARHGHPRELDLPRADRDGADRRASSRTRRTRCTGCGATTRSAGSGSPEDVATRGALPRVRRCGLPERGRHRGRRRRSR